MRSSVLWLLALAGCSGGDLFVGLVPELPADTSLIGVLFLDGAGNLIEATGLMKVGEAHGLSLSESAPDPEQLLVVAYDDAILDPRQREDDATLDAANLRFATADEPALPTPSFVALGPAGASEQLSPGSLPGPLTAHWVKPCARSACDRLRFAGSRAIAVPGERNDILRTVLPTDDREGALLVSSSTDAMVYRFDAPDRIQSISGPLIGVRARAAQRLVDGRVLILQQDGTLYAGTSEGGFGLHLQSSISAEMSNITAASWGTELDVYAQDNRARVHRLEPDGWQLVHDPGQSPSGYQDIEWLGPSELLSIASDGEQIVHLVDEMPVGTRQTEQARLILPVKGLGAVIPAGQALTLFEPGVYVWTPSSFQLLPIPAGGRSPEAIWSGLEAGEFFYGGANGELSVYADGLGFCVLPFFSGEAIRNVTWLNEGLLVVARRAEAFEGDTEVIYVPYAEPPRPSCEQAYGSPR